MSRPIRRIVPFAVIAIAAAVAMPSASSASSSCKIGDKESRTFGPTYVVKLRVTGTSCANVKALT